jgi:hypothetical protein
VEPRLRMSGALPPLSHTSSWNYTYVAYYGLELMKMNVGAISTLTNIYANRHKQGL